MASVLSLHEPTAGVAAFTTAAGQRQETNERSAPKFVEKSNFLAADTPTSHILLEGCPVRDDACEVADDAHSVLPGVGECLRGTGWGCRRWMLTEGNRPCSSASVWRPPSLTLTAVWLYPCRSVTSAAIRTFWTLASLYLPPGSYSRFNQSTSSSWNNKRSPPTTLQLPLK